MGGFVKLQSSILQSTVWREPNHIRILWITMLAMKDRNGIVEASIPGLADAARITLEECEEGLTRLSSPDKYSRTSDHGGRRIEEIDGGWRILNNEKYREETSADRMRRHRAKKRTVTNVTESDVTLSQVTGVTPPDPRSRSRSRSRSQIPEEYISSNDKTSKVDIDLQPLEESLKFLPEPKDRDIARFIASTWPDCPNVDAVGWVQQSKTYLNMFEADPLEWLEGIAKKWPPSRKVVDQGRNKLYQFLMSCAENEVKKQKLQHEGETTKTGKALQKIMRRQGEHREDITEDGGLDIFSDPVGLRR